jgi:hypothetical protein
MPTTEREPTRRAELFVRSDLPEPSEKRRAAVERRLEELQSAGVFDEYDTTVWRKRVPIAGAGDCPEGRLYNEFAEWAADSGVCLSPFFDTRRCYSTETGEKRRELVMPALCLAVYEGGELARVAPFASGGSPHSIEDCIDDMESGQEPTVTETIGVSTAD